MKQEVVRLKDRIAGGIKVRLDALSPEQRMHVVIGMFCILVVLLLFCIWQTVTDIANNRRDGMTIVIEHIDKPVVIGSVRDRNSLTTNEKSNGERRKGNVGSGTSARQSLGQLIPGGAEE